MIGAVTHASWSATAAARCSSLSSSHVIFSGVNHLGLPCYVSVIDSDPFMIHAFVSSTPQPPVSQKCSSNR